MNLTEHEKPLSPEEQRLVEVCVRAASRAKRAVERAIVDAFCSALSPAAVDELQRRLDND